MHRTTVVHISCTIDLGASLADADSRNNIAKLDHSSRGTQIVKDKDETSKRKVYTLPQERQEALRKYLAKVSRRKH